MDEKQFKEFEKDLPREPGKSRRSRGSNELRALMAGGRRPVPPPAPAEEAN